MQAIIKIVSFLFERLGRHGSLCFDDKVALAHAMKEAMIESIHTSHPGSWGLTYLLRNAWWPNINLEILAKATK